MFQLLRSIFVSRWRLVESGFVDLKPELEEFPLICEIKIEENQFKRRRGRMITPVKTVELKEEYACYLLREQLSHRGSASDITPHGRS